MKKQRPIHLDLRTIRQPATAIVSILHRISGIIMLFSIGILLWLLHNSLVDAQGFKNIQMLFDSIFFKFILWGILTALGYHLLGGIRHIIVDTGHWDELESGNLSAKAVMVLAVVLSLLMGIWIW